MASNRRRSILLVPLTLLTLVGSIFQSIPASAAEPFTVRTTGDTSDANLSDDECADIDTFCTLRAAIEQANATAGADIIDFNIPPTGGHTISIFSALPDITGSVEFDATTQDGYTGTPLIRVDGTPILPGPPVDGLVVDATDVTISGLSVTNFSGTGISIGSGSDGAVVTNSYIGIDPDGGTDNGNGEEGVRVETSVNVVIGPGNTISDNGNSGIRLIDTTGASVYGNTIGLAGDGVTPLGNDAFGIMVQAGPASEGPGNSGTTIGGASSEDANVIGGNAYGGILVFNEASDGPAVVRDLTIQNNYIGTTPSNDEVGNGGESGAGSRSSARAETTTS